MKLKFCVVLAAAVILPHLLIAENAQTHSASARVATAKALANLPLSFAPAPVPGQFVARSGGNTISVGATESYVALRDKNSATAKVLRYSFEHSNRSAVAEGIEPLPGVINQYRGRDPRNWRLGIPTFAKVRANNVYPGVDVLYYGDQRRLEFDFIVAPNSDPGAIALAFDGADKLWISAAGDLVAEIDGREIRFAKPFAYQRIAGERTPVSVEYVLDQGRARLRLGAYAKSAELVIDPVLTYSTFLGGGQADVANGIAVDAAGNAYVAGQTCSSDFIAPSPNSSGTTFKGALGACDAYVTKLDPAGTTLLYTTFIAGQLPSPPNATATANGIAVDAAGRAYIVGTTNFWDLPLTTPNPIGRLSPYNGGDSDAFITILNPNGTLLRQTYLGGSNIDQGYGIAVDSQLNVAAVGQTCSSDFPAYNSIQAKVEACVAFVTKLDFGLHIAPPVLPGASPVSPRPASLSDACGYGAACPTTPDATQTYYFFSTLFGGQPLPPEPTWPSLSGPSYRAGVQVPVGAITIATPDCGVGSNDKPQVLLAEPAGDPYLSGISVKLDWPCGSVKVKAGIPDEGGFVWYDLGDAPPAIAYASTEAYGVALDPVGDVFAVGGTNTADLTPYLFYANFHGINYGKTGPWALKLGSLLGDHIYATSLGTSPTENPAQSVNAAKGIAVDTSGDAYIVGTATGGLLTTSGAANSSTVGGQDAFVVKLNKPASAFDYATYLGGTKDEQGLAIAIDNGGSAYITGSTTSTDLPVTNPLVDANGNAESALLGAQDVFIARLTPTGSGITMMAYLGGAASEQGNAIVLDQSGKGDIYIAGTTQSLDFPLLPAAPPAALVVGQTSYGGGTSDAFVTMINGASFPQAQLTPTTLNFGSQNVGGTGSTLTVSLRNIGNGILSISGISIVGTGGDYSQTNNCPSQLSPAGGAKDNCTITVTFTPTAGGSRSDILEIVDNSIDSPQIVALSGTGVVVQGVIQLSPTTLAFGNQQTGTTSAAKAVTLTNTSSTYALTISSITVGTDFSQTNNCPVSPATLATNGTCTIQVTFAPATVGDKTANLTITGQAANSPQSVGLGGTGTAPGSSGSPDFTLKSSQTSISIAATGGNASFNVSATPLNNFKETLNFTCSLAGGATCVVSPSSLVMDGTSIPSVAVTVSIAASGGGGTPPNKGASIKYGPRAIFATVLPFCLLGMVVIGKKRRMMLLLLVVLIGTMLFSASCANNNGSNRTTTVLPGVYQVTITGGSTGTGAVSHTLAVPLNVN